ncbi:MAG: SpoVG family protein [Bacteroidota bacterium]
MTITSVRFNGNPSSDFLSFVSVVFDDAFVIRNIRLVKSKFKPGEIMLCMPSRTLANGDYENIAHPITVEFRAYMESYIIQAWNDQRTAAKQPAS